MHFHLFILNYFKLFSQIYFIDIFHTLLLFIYLFPFIIIYFYLSMAIIFFFTYLCLLKLQLRHFLFFFLLACSFLMLVHADQAVA